MRVFCLLIAILFLNNGLVFAQSQEISSTSSYNVEMPSPTAASITKFKSIPVGHSSGTPNVSIPLYEVKSRSLSIPLNLSYNASGIRPSEIPGWVGLGWGISIGSVSRTVYGLPDESSNGYYFNYDESQKLINNTFSTTQDKLNYYDSIIAWDLDTEPDVFTVNAPGLSATFMFKEGEAVLFPHKNIKIVETITSNQLTKFVIINEDGVIYTFDRTEQTQTSSFTKSGQGDNNNLPSQTYYSSWYLTKIETPGQEESINISYQTGATVEYFVLNKTNTYTLADASTSCTNSNTNENYSYRKHKTWTYFPSVITSSNEKVIFALGSASVTGENGGGTVNYSTLNSITIKDNDETYQKRKIEFIGNKFLTELKVSDSNSKKISSHEFQYIDTGSFPNYDTWDIDYWGYSNGANNNDLIANVQSFDNDFTGISGLGGADREPDSDYTEDGMLKKIIYPTGGYSEFNYEPNEYYFSGGSNTIAGGVRIEEVKTHDGISSSNDIITKYEYTKASDPTKSSGYNISGDNLFRPYQYSEDASYSNEIESGSSSTNCKYVIRNSGGASLTGSSVAYREVKEVVYKGATQSGYTWSELQYSLQTGRNPYSYKRGKLLGKAVYDDSANKIYETTYTYDYDTEFIDDIWAVEVEVELEVTQQSIKVYRDRRFQYKSYFIYQNTENTTTYNGDSGSQVTSTVAYNYGESDTGNGVYQLNSMTETNSNGDSRTTWYKYAHTVTNDGEGPTVNYGGMHSLHMFSQKYSTMVKSGSDSLSKSWVRWDNNLDGVSGKWFPQARWIWKPSLVSDVTTPPHPTTESIKVQQINHYNSLGNIIEFQDALGTKTSITYSEDGYVPTGIFTNAAKEKVFAHSFRYEEVLAPWVYINRLDPNNSIIDVYNGKLRISDAGAVAGERDRVQYTHTSELTGTSIWEFDLTIADSDNKGLLIASGGSGWNGYSSGSSESVAWAGINNEDFVFRDIDVSTSQLQVGKAGLEIGRTYSFKIVMNSTTEEVTYYIDGEEIAANISYSKTSSGVKRLTLANWGDNTLSDPWYIDNIRFYPESAHATTQEVDPLYLAPTSIKDVSGFTNRFGYDGFGRLKVHENVLGGATRNSYFYSSIGYGTYDTSHPNYVKTETGTDWLEDDFSSSSGWEKYGDYTFNHSYQGETTVRLGISGSSWSSIYKNPVGKNVSARVDFYPDNTTGGADDPYVLAFNDPNSSATRFAVRYDLSDNRFIIYYRINNGSWNTVIPFSLSAPRNKWYTIEIEKYEGICLAWVYEKGKDRSTGNSYSISGFPSEWDAEIRMWSKDDYFYLANFEYMVNPVSSITYFDGLGRGIQTQQIGGNTVIASETEYNEQGLSEAVSLAAEVSGSGYIQYMLADLPNALPNGTPVEDYYDNFSSTASNSGYAYLYSTYESSPSSRKKEAYLPGIDGVNRIKTTYSYDLNASSDEIFSTSSPTKNWAQKELIRTVKTDPEGKKMVTYSDAWGQTIVSGTDMEGDGKLTGIYRESCSVSNCDLITEFAYDLRGNLIRSEDPRGIPTTYTYNQVGQLVEKRLPDQTQKNEYVYDNKGRLRFHKDPNSYSSGFYYTKYDDLDRVIEIGFHDIPSGFTTSNANDESYPEEYLGATYFIQYSYDGTNAASGAQNLKGRLSQIKYIDLSSVSNSGYTWYSYNKLGLVEWVKQRLPGQSSTLDKKIEYSYDALGRLTRLFFDPPGTNEDHYFWYYYDELGRLEKLTSHHTVSEGSATTEAEYIYFADGRIKQLKLGESAQIVDYSYTIQGWLDKINDGSLTGTDKFSLDLNYLDNGNISQQLWRQSAKSTSTTYNYYYTYDDANRLTLACYSASCSSMSDYDVDYDYDRNGNITTLLRHNENGNYYESNYNGTGQPYLGGFSFTMVPGTTSGSNRVQSLKRYGTSTTYDYSYDANGNVTENEIQGVTSTSYDWRNLPKSMVTSEGVLYFAYDADGNRVKKQVNGGDTLWYVRGASGEIVAVYKGNVLRYINIPGGIGLISK